MGVRPFEPLAEALRCAVNDPKRKIIVEALIAVAWVDSRLEAPEAGIILGMLSGFDASQVEEDELLAYAQEPRTLDPGILSGLTMEERELLLGNAVLLVRVDGHLAHREKQLLGTLIELLGIAPQKVEAILKEAGDGAFRLSDGALKPG